MCRDRDTGSYLKSQGHKRGSKVKNDTFCRVRAITPLCMDGFKKEKKHNFFLDRQTDN